MTLNENNWIAKNRVINVGKKWTLQMLLPQSPVLVLKLSPTYMVSLNTIFLIPQNQCYPEIPSVCVQMNFRGHFKPPPNATIQIMFEVISVFVQHKYPKKKAKPVHHFYVVFDTYICTA